MEYFDLLSSAAKNVNIQLNEDKYNKFIKYMNMIIEWNKVMNLTAITQEEEIVKKHFIDSINIFSFDKFNDLKSIIDIGTGAGLPGIPISIMRPDIKILLVDSLKKRINFLNEVINELQLENVTAIHGRAEEIGQDKKYRQNFDGAVSRAVANMNMLCEFCIPLVKVDGYFIAMKGPSITEELNNSKAAIKKLGGEIIEIKMVEIDKTDLQHNLVIIKKVNNTSTQYPRKFGTMKKKPIL